MFDSNFIADPYPTYAKMREAAPLHWVPEFGGGAWLIPRYNDVFAAVQEPRLSAKRGHRFVEQYPQEQREAFADFGRLLAMWIVFLDPPRHTVWRRLLAKGFSAADLAERRPQISALAHRLIDRVHPSGGMDFIRDFAYLLPAMVMLDLLGVDADHRDEVIGWSDDLARFFGNARSPIEVAVKGRTALLSLSDYFKELLEARRANPGSDLISLVLRAEEGDDRITADELAAQCTALIFGGHETTRNLIGNGLLALLRNRDQLELLRRDPALMPAAVRELSRYDTPLQMSARIVAEPFEMHGRELKPGQIVVTMFGSANRDSAKFKDPDVLDVARKEATNLSFGKGPHFCVGSTLASIEAEVAFATVLERMPNVRLADEEIRWVHNMNFRGVQSLPLRF